MKHLLSAFLCIACTNLLGQTFSTKFKTSLGSPYTMVDAEECYFFTNYQEILSAKIKGATLTIQKIDKITGKEFQRKEFKDFYTDKTFILEEIAEWQGHYYLFFSTKKGKELFLSYRELNFSDQTLGAPKTLITLSGNIIPYTCPIAPYNPFGQRHGQKFGFKISQDRKKLCISHILEKEEKEFTVGFHIYTSLSQPALWAGDISMPYKTNEMKIGDYLINNKGDIYLLGKIYNSDHLSYQIEICRISKESQSPNFKKIKINGDIDDARLVESPFEQMYCMGYYHLGSKIGSYIVPFDHTIRTNQKQEILIPDKLGLLYESKEQITHVQMELWQNMPRVMLHDVEFSFNGDIILLGEQVFNSPGTIVVSKSILALKVTNNGELTWAQKIPKQQKGGYNTKVDERFLLKKARISYRYIKLQNYHALIFMDNVRNFNLPTDQTASEHLGNAGGYLSIYLIDDLTGTTSQHLVFNSREMPNVEGNELYNFMLDRIIPVFKDELYIEFFKKNKEDLLIKIKME